jgi:hypothetical protein
MKILVLAPSGFGKTTAIGPTEELDIKGLNPEDTYIISVTTKDLPFKGSRKLFPVTTINDLSKGRRVCIKNPNEAVFVMQQLANSKTIKNIILDDANYLMQDWYMDNALAKGWDAPKQIGVFMGKLFASAEQLDSKGKNFIMLAHPETFEAPDGRTIFKLKTTGKMVNEYITPEGKFDVVLLGVSIFDGNTKQVGKYFLTRENENYIGAKSGFGMFPDEKILNDLGLVVPTVQAYYEGL